MGLLNVLRHWLGWRSRKAGLPRAVVDLGESQPYLLVTYHDGSQELIAKDTYDYLHAQNSQSHEQDRPPSQRQLDGMLAGVTRVRVLAGGMSRGEPLATDELVDVHTKESLEALKEALRVREDPGTFKHCCCMGGPTLELYSDTRLLARLAIHHGHSIRWREWNPDAQLSRPGLLGRWLADMGIDGEVLNAIYTQRYSGELPFPVPTSEQQRKAQKLVRRAYLLGQESRFQMAIDHCTEALESDPECAVAYGVRATVRAGLEEHEGAIADVNRMLELGPELPKFYILRSKSRYCTGDWEGALLDCREALRLEPGLVEAYSTRGGIYEGLGRLAEAVREYEALVELEPESSSAHLDLARARSQNGDLSGSLESLNKALDLDRDNLAALFYRGLVFSRLGRPRESIQDLTKSIERDPSVPLAWVARGRVRARTGDDKGASEDFQRATELTASPATTCELRHSLALQDGEYQEAIEMLSNAMDIVPDGQELLLKRASARWMAGRLDEAAEDYNQAFLATGGSWHLYLGRGYVFAELEDYEAALTDLEEAVRLSREGKDPRGTAYSLNGHGLALAGLGRVDESFKDFEESLRICPRNAWVYFNRASVLERLGRLSEAMQDYQKALECQEPALAPRQREQAQIFIEQRNAVGIQGRSVR